MVENKKVLILGGTGAMGVYLAPRLASLNNKVTVVSLDDYDFGHPLITHVHADAMDYEFLKDTLKEGYDAIVDFLVYNEDQLKAAHPLLMQNTDHYFFLSSYRVYGGGFPVTEETPRLLDCSEDKDFLATHDYALYKARGEDIIQSSPFKNWTIVRPAITFSKRRFQLVTLEAPVVVGRAMKDRPIVLPREALGIQGTMSWAGDVAEMFARLILNPGALGEAFTISTAEHHSWEEIAGYYNEIIGLEYVPASAEEYVEILGGWKNLWYQLVYDRMFTRIIDNSKILRVTGLKQEDLTPMRKALEMELTALPKDYVWPDDAGVGERMDQFINR